ncbi:hypothetical protein CCHR01_05362 [Colletotrichum chrysophilum]|uniref:Uncharacterized protein n=1 Tax=Colletotrichum chrysophilum TaxID=1836956 RepID=A0AAD9API5_9PEZI|nr:hypothetical protein CCHR01_05362 [Colletotrichum chrysophilum]
MLEKNSDRISDSADRQIIIRDEEDGVSRNNAGDSPVFTPPKFETVRPVPIVRSLIIADRPEQPPRGIHNVPRLQQILCPGQAVARSPYSNKRRPQLPGFPG